MKIPYTLHVHDFEKKKQRKAAINTISKKKENKCDSSKNKTFYHVFPKTKKICAHLISIRKENAFEEHNYKGQRQATILTISLRKERKEALNIWEEEKTFKEYDFKNLRNPRLNHCLQGRK